MTFQDPGARVPVDIQVRLRGGNAPPIFNPDTDSPEYQPPQQAAPPAAAPTYNPDIDAPEYDPGQPPPPEKQIGTGQTFASHLANTLEIGLGPMVEGLASAAGPEWNQSQAGHDIAPIIGAAKLLHETITSHPTLSSLITGEQTPVLDSYKAGRDAAQGDLDLGAKQHRWASIAGQLAGAVIMPIPGLGEAGLGARLLKGAAAGGVLGGAQSAGEAFSRGKTAAEAGKEAAIGGLIGGATGGLLHGVLGPRLPRPATTPGARAAETFAAQGTPVGRGFTSDNIYKQAATSHFRSVPIIGSILNNQLRKAAEKSGERLSDLSQSLTGGASSRAEHATIMNSALKHVIKFNKDRADALYNGVRGMIDPKLEYVNSNTRKAVDEVIAERRAAGNPNPEAGLEQASNVADRAGFNGLHRARYETRNEGNKLNPHPGYDAHDWAKITEAMTKDLRAQVYDQGGQKALDAFDHAESEFGPIADQDKELHDILKAGGQASIERLLSAAKEKGGDVPLLANLKGKMSPADFQHIGGALLGELGRASPDAPFSFARFVTGYGKLSKNAKQTLFTPSHLKDLDDLFGAGQHLGKALEESNTSHTAAPILAFEAIKDVAEMVWGLASGHAGAGTAMALGGTGAAAVLGMWLASPAKTAAMRAFTKSYGAWRVSPTPARAAVFKLATRNLATNLGVPVERIAERFTGAQPQSENPQPSP